MLPRDNQTTTLRQISNIDLTPLMDLTFILLITFIITFPLIEQGVPLNLPKAETAPLQDDTARAISVDAAGQIYLDDLPVSLEELARDMDILGSVDPMATVLVRADEALAYGRVVEVLKILTDAGISGMALVTAPDQP
jgi:biopolymer transport protein TolR